MGTFFKLIVLIGALWLVDALAFGGRYGMAIQEQANYQGQRLDTKFVIGSKGSVFEPSL